MKRLHVHVAVENLDQSIKFYSALFAAQPSVAKPDYAKWMLEDPRVNFAISTRGGGTGLDHLGIQVEDAAELQEVYGRLKQAERPVLEEGQTTCCYAQSEKSWISDPQGVAWETFLTTGESTTYGSSARRGEMGGQAAGETAGEAGRATAACCAPAAGEVPKPKAATACCG